MSSDTAGETAPVALVERRHTSNVVDVLKHVLAQAEAGEIVDVAIVEVHRGRTVGYAWSDGDNYHLLNSGAARLALRIAGDDIVVMKD